MGSNGYIALHRKIRDSRLWNQRPFAKGQAWVDLLFRAAYRDHHVEFQGCLVFVERGSLVTSYRILAREWGWSTKRVGTFLRNLANSESIVVNSRDRERTQITICNYNTYQPMGNRGETEGKQQGNRGETREKKEKKDKKGKKTTLSRDARRVLEFFNLKSGHQYEPVESNLKLIRARLRELGNQGYADPIGYAMLVGLRCVNNANDPDHYFEATYLRPATVFNATKFWQYAGEIPPEVKGEDDLQEQLT